MIRERLAATAALWMTLTLACGCDEVQQATSVECTALFDHIVDVTVRENTQKPDGNDDPGAALAGAVAGALGRAALEGLGEKEKFLNRCQTTMRKFEVKACLKKDSSAELKECGAP